MISFAQDNGWNRVSDLNTKRESSHDEPSKLSRANFALLACGVLQARSWPAATTGNVRRGSGAHV